MADIILICFIALYAYNGFKNGFIKTVIGFASTLISLFLTSIIYPPVSNALYNIGVGELAKKIVLNMIKNKPEINVMSEYAAEVAAPIIVNIISFIIVIVVIKIILAILIESLNIVARLPIIRQANSALGILAGIVSGILISYIVIGIISALSDYDSMSIFYNYIENSKFAIIMSKNNIVTNLLTDILND